MTTDARRRSTLQVARSPGILRYLVGNSTSNVGTWCYNLAAGILVFRLTGSALLVGLATSAQFVGTVALAPWAGAAADRFDRRRLLMVIQALGSVVSGALAAAVALDLASAPMVIATSVLLGLGTAVATPALQALVPSLVDDPADLETAVALNSVTFNLARAIGPLLAAVLIGTWGVGAAMAFNTISYLVLVAALSGLPLEQRSDRASTRVRFRDTAGDAWRDPTVRRLLVSVAAVSVTVDPVTTLAPTLTVDVFGRDDAAAGLLLAAFGTGATFTALGLSGLIRRTPHSLEVTLVLTSLGVVVAATAPAFEIALAGLVVAGGGSIGSMTRATAQLYRSVDRAGLGRTMALWGVAFLGTRPIAATVDGLLADLAGPRVAAATMALAGVTMALVWMRSRRRPEVTA